MFFSIPITAPDTTQSITTNLLAEYGEVSMKQVRAMAEATAASNDRTRR
jgi:nicotinamide mononucleotide (NMN) deamidase PncC